MEHDSQCASAFHPNSVYYGECNCPVSDTKRLERVERIVNDEGRIIITRKEIEAAGGIRAFLNALGDGHAPF